MKQIKGILFDFDGVIADSEKLWFSSAISTLKRMNISYDNSIKQKSTIGIISEHLFQTLITDKQYDYHAKKQWVFEHINQALKRPTLKT